MKCTILKHNYQANADSRLVYNREVSAIAIQFKPKNRRLFHVH